MSNRFYCPDPPKSGRYRLFAEEAHHLARVSRHVPGDVVELFDGKGLATIARVIEIAGDTVDLVAEGSAIAEKPPACELTLATAIPKGERFDWLVEKATELGVCRLIPLVMKRSVVDPRGSKLERLRRTIIQASKQARRNRLMVLDSPMSWTEVIESTSSALGLIAEQSGLPPRDWPRIPQAEKVVLAVGPEGGFTLEETGLARAAGWFPVCLSPNVLRVETAGIAGAAAILALCEE